MSLVVITGWIAAILTVFNFATCFVLPWSKKQIDECDGKTCRREGLTNFHKPIVWMTIIAILVHIAAALFG
jgi:cytochrome b561